MAKFCPQCGKQAQLTHKFCGSCGASLNSLTQPQAQAKNVPTTFTPFSPDIDDEDDSYLDRVEHCPIQISKIELEPVRTYNNRETIGSLQANPIDPSEIQKRTGPYLNIDRNQFIESFKQETSNAPKQ